MATILTIAILAGAAYVGYRYIAAQKADRSNGGTGGSKPRDIDDTDKA